jgi:hypothetical protein
LVRYGCTAAAARAEAGSSAHAATTTPAVRRPLTRPRNVPGRTGARAGQTR